MATNKARSIFSNGPSTWQARLSSASWPSQHPPDEDPSLNMLGLAGSRAAGLHSLGRATWGLRDAGGHDRWQRAPFFHALNECLMQLVYPLPTPSFFFISPRSLLLLLTARDHEHWALGQLQAADGCCGEKHGLWSQTPWVCFLVWHFLTIGESQSLFPHLQNRHKCLLEL